MMNTNDSTNACPKCGAPIPADAPRGLCPKCVLAGAAADSRPSAPATATGEIPSLARLATAFPQLEILELIGRGGMGFVFKARQPHLDRFVALKLLPDKLARDSHFTERFNREGRVLAKLNHPNIVSVFDFGRTEDFYFLTMEYVDGVNLRQAMQAGRFSPSEALAIVPRICDALQYAHEQGVLHRDIKPENILLDAKGRVKIADFGIAKLVDEDPASVTLTGTGAALGTPHYMAPEQLEKPSSVDHRADIYSLGVVFYELLTGELPIGRFAPPSAKTPVNARVDEVVFRTLEKDREKRFQSAGEVKTQVEHLTESGVEAKPAAPSATGATGPHGTVVLSQVEKPRYAFRAFAGAGLVGVSLVEPLTVLASLLARRGGIGPGELWVALGSVAVLGLGGTLVGWLALNEIRDGQGAVRGLPLALFATLTWPLLALVGVTLGPAMFMLVPAGGSGLAHWLGRALVLLLPAGVLTFVLWTVHATARWATAQPQVQRRGVLKWIFAGLLACGIGVALVSGPGTSASRTARPAPIEESIPARQTATPWVENTQPESFASPEVANGGIRIKLRIAKGQVATLELMRRDTDPPTPVPFFSGFVEAPDDERGRVEFFLLPLRGQTPQTNPPAWTMKLVAEDGATTSGGLEEFGPLIPIVSPQPNSFIEIGPGADMELMLTRPYSAADTNGVPPRAQLSLSIHAHNRRAVSPTPVESTVVSLGSTNWIASEKGRHTATTPGREPEILAYQWRQSPAGTNTTNWIRFTMTAVELRHLADGRWLAMDYISDVHGACERSFRTDSTGFKPVTRTTEFLVQSKDSPPVTHQRVEWRLPDAVKEADALAFRDTLAKYVVMQSLTVYEGEQRPLFRFPIGTIGDLSVGLGAKLRQPPSPLPDREQVPRSPTGQTGTSSP